MARLARLECGSDSNVILTVGNMVVEIEMASNSMALDLTRSLIDQSLLCYIERIKAYKLGQEIEEEICHYGEG